MREPVFRHFEAGARRAHLAPQIRDLGDRHAALLGDDDETGFLQSSMQRRDRLFFLRAVHGSSPLLLVRSVPTGHSAPVQTLGTAPQISRGAAPVYLSQKFKPSLPSGIEPGR